MILKTTYKRRPIDYGEASGYGWTNDPFSDPIDQLEKRKHNKAREKRKYKKRPSEKETVI